MTTRMRNFGWMIILLVISTGCNSLRRAECVKRSVADRSPSDRAHADLRTDDHSPDAENDEAAQTPADSISLVSQTRTTDSGSYETAFVRSVLAGDEPTNSDEEAVRPADDDDESSRRLPEVESASPRRNLGDSPDAVQLDEVVSSVYRSYPLLQAALYNRNIALGQQIGASGAFDTKLKGASENGPLGFYETYRQSIGVVQPTYWGGEVFAGYRVGRGSFQPWYQERLTNDAGEFKAGVQIPLARNRTIDARRAELWKSGLERNIAEPDIQAHLISFVLEASFGYWDWVAAGENHRIAIRVLRLAEARTESIDAQVRAGLTDPPELTDNLRLVAIREAKVADTLRKLQQTASKLSIYLRDDSGIPLVPAQTQLPGFPIPEPVADELPASDIQVALTRRPELRVLDLMQRQIQIDYSEARNQMQPELNAVLIGSQDVGEASSSKKDKSPYEGEASLYLDVPLQRRKAQGKMTELQGKLAQLAAKRRLVADKISVDVQIAHAALRSAWEQVKQTDEALRHAEDLAERERMNLAKGASDILKVTLREQYAVESAEKNVDALQLYFESLAAYRAALALDEIGMNPSE